MTNYPYYESCTGCGERLLISGSFESRKIVEFEIKLINCSVKYLPFFSHRDCIEESKRIIRSEFDGILAEIKTKEN